MLNPPEVPDPGHRAPSPGKIYAALAVAVGSASFASILIRLAQPYAPSLVIAAYRLSLAALLLWPILLVRRQRQPTHLQPAVLGMTALSGALLALHFGTWISSLAYTSVASSAVLVATAPLFVALLSPITLGERVPSRLFIGLALGLLGVLVIAASDVCASTWPPRCPSPSTLLGSSALLGDLLALVGAVTVAGYLLIGRSLRLRVPLLPYLTLTYTAAAICLIGASAAFDLPLTGYPVQALGLFALLAVFPQLIAHSTYNWAVRHAAAAPVALTLLGEPVGAILLAALLLHERPEPMELAGVVLILVGIWLGAQSSARQSSSVQPAK
jgi:drug/metabolite transporter (DMT)-like permease